MEKFYDFLIGVDIAITGLCLFLFVFLEDYIYFLMAVVFVNLVIYFMLEKKNESR